MEKLMQCKSLFAALLAASAVAACAGDPGAVGAQGPARDSASAGASVPAAPPAFDKLDANGDGFLSLTESAADSRISRDFLRADKDRDWRLNREEFDSAFRR
jgi:hypothetical protein